MWMLQEKNIDTQPEAGLVGAAGSGRMLVPAALVVCASGLQKILPSDVTKPSS